MRANENARKSKSKQPCSLTLEKENLARARFKANKISGYMSQEKRDLVDIMSMNHNGLIDNAVYHRYKKLLDQREKNQKEVQGADDSQQKARGKS